MPSEVERVEMIGELVSTSNLGIYIQGSESFHPSQEVVQYFLFGVRQASREFRPAEPHCLGLVCHLTKD